MSPDTAELASAVRAGERRALAKAITLVESTRPEHEASAEALLGLLEPALGRARRLGVCGPPGVGKSTLIDALGLEAIAGGHKVGVLAVDPSSERTGGSLLGDRTRMARLAGSPAAFVRPSPSSGAHRGLGRRTREALLVLEAAGYDLLILETVGIGQGELGVAEVVDLVLLLAMAGAGDDVQGLKRGILEHADLIAVTKADGADAERALDAARALESLFGSIGSGVPVLATSALSSERAGELWAALDARFATLAASGEAAARRAEQRRAWFRAALLEAVTERLSADPRLSAERAALEAALDRAELSPRAAARKLVGLL